jgi:hypothetical protein
MKASKQRRVFDSTKQRLAGTEAAAYVRKGGKGRNEPAKPQVKDTWNNHFKSIISFVYSIRFLSQIGDRNMKILFKLFDMLNKRQIMRNQVRKKLKI